MSDYQQKDGQGILFKNDRKTKDSQPDYSGSVTVDGKKRSIAGWIKEGKKRKFMSLSVKEWEDNAVRTPRQNPSEPPVADEDFGDRIPF